MFTVEEILESTGGKLLSGGLKTAVAGVSIDSRKTLPGELFIAIKGKNFDGHDFVEEALKKDAIGAVVSRWPVGPLARWLGQTVLIRVQDTVRALGDLALAHRKKFAIPIIGITGSNGKTTTKDMVAEILCRRWSTLKSEASFNNFIGIPLTLFRLSRAHQIGVLELGTSRLGEIKRLSEIAQPLFGVITNIGPSHLEFFGSIDVVYRAKVELLEALGEGSLACLNGDDPRLLKLARYFGLKVVTFGMDGPCDFRATQITYQACGLTFLLNGRHPVELKLLGRPNVYNALASIAITSVVGVDLGAAREALLEFRPPRGRMELKEVGGIKIIDDTYNSNPQSLGCAIEILSRFSASRKILVSGDMLEQGVEASQAHYRMGRMAAEAGIDLLISVGQFSREISKGALRYGMGEKEVYEFDSHEEASQKLLEVANEGDAILVKGSRETRMERIVERLINNNKVENRE